MTEKGEDISIGQLLCKIFYATAIADKVIREEKMIERIMKTAYKIVASFSNSNKSEIIFVSQLRNALVRI